MQRRSRTRHRRKDTRRRKRGVTTPSTLRQLACLFPDTTLFRGALYRLRSLPRHPIRRPTESQHARQNLRLDSRDAAQSGETRHSCVRSPCSISQTYRHFQNHWHLHWHPQSRLQNPHNAHLPPLFGINLLLSQQRIFQLKPTQINAILSLTFSGLTWKIGSVCLRS